MKLQPQTYPSSLSHADISERTDVRWWMAAGMHTDETLREELRERPRNQRTGAVPPSQDPG